MSTVLFGCAVSEARLRGIDQGERMEHRCATRRPVCLNVLIYRQGLPIQAGRTRDLSTDGAFVETKGLCCNKDDCLDVEFLATGHFGCERFRVKALVVHSSKEGIGFEFNTLGGESMDALQRCLRIVRQRERLLSDLEASPPVAVGFS